MWVHACTTFVRHDRAWNWRLGHSGASNSTNVQTEQVFNTTSRACFSPSSPMDDAMHTPQALLLPSRHAHSPPFLLPGLISKLPALANLQEGHAQKSRRAKKVNQQSASEPSLHSSGSPGQCIPRVPGASTAPWPWRRAGPLRTRTCPACCMGGVESANGFEVDIMCCVHGLMDACAGRVKNW